MAAEYGSAAILSSECEFIDVNIKFKDLIRCRTEGARRVAPPHSRIWLRCHGRRSCRAARLGEHLTHRQSQHLCHLPGVLEFRL